MNTETKRHIDAARQVLVGVVPNPTSQIDQITNALIYKFMDDMDQSAIKQGGEASFFTGDLEQYAWTRLMNPGIGNQERMNVYSEALIKFSESKQLPPLFREIFKSAFLPYRSPEVLGLFLKEINYFDYSHSEELGNAYEYLLSIMSSQGDAGQFRTPRHIIDFMVDVVGPTMDDRVLDPACGTGGFLVSAYKHILEQHDGKNSDGTKNKEIPLTPDQRKNLMGNFEGYDIDPGMVRIAQVNMYLHQFKNPKIYSYDTLSMDERWGDKFSVILANPPFMSPKGGVSTHSKFSIQSNRSEVLFVDYIMNHLRPQGRAAVIVPEGIIFQSGTAHKQLRKNLVEDGLYAVISLPSGVFQPYSGVKTSILLFNNELAKKSKEILFVKIENDGFDLGATKRSISKNDLPEALEILNNWKAGEKVENSKVLYVEKTKIAESGDYNLSVDRYRAATDCTSIKYPIIELGEIAEVLKGTAITKKDTIEGNIPVIAGGQQPAYYHNKSNRDGEVITVSASGAYAGFMNYFETPIFASDCSTIQTKNRNLVSTKYLFNFLKTKQQDIYAFQQGGGQPHVYPKDLKLIKIPLPPLAVQNKIVEQMKNKQEVVDHAKAIIKNLEKERGYFGQMLKKLNDVEWVEIGEVCELEYGFTEKAKEDGDARFIRITDIDETGKLKNTEQKFIDLTDEAKKFLLQKSDILVARTGATYGKTVIFNDDYPAVFASYLIKISFDKNKVIPSFYWLFAQSDEYWEQAKSLMTGGGQQQFNANAIKKIKVPIIPFEIQKQMVEEMEKEEKIIATNRQLIEIMEKKIFGVLSDI